MSVPVVERELWRRIMALKFGTSGVRGLVTEMTDRECFLYARAFLEYLKSKTQAQRVAMAGDLRSSTPGIMKAVALAVAGEGLALDYCGLISSSAVALHGISNNMASIMITGSHIPDDRNGIKFNMPWGELLKDHEVEISGRYARLKASGSSQAGDCMSFFADDGSFKSGECPELPQLSSGAAESYRGRYLKFFGENALNGLKVVLYEHSSVSRDMLFDILDSLGAEVVRVGRSDTFVAVDTEAVQNAGQLATWVSDHLADVLVSTDGDGDRPLVVDDRGKIIRGDVLGILVAAFLDADSVSTPVSCNTALESCGRFGSVSRTRIGSPYVVSSMLEAVEAGRGTVVGYEANGGFLTATDIVSSATGEVLKALPTRDAVLPILAILSRGAREKKTISAIREEVSGRYTYSGLLRPFDTEEARRLIETMRTGGEEFVGSFLGEAFGAVGSLDFTDGARITLAGGDIVHFRPSGNAPEFRCYTEASSEETARRNNEKAMAILEKEKGWAG